MANRTKKSKTPSLPPEGLRAYFESGFKPPSRFGVGLEYERFGIRTSPVGSPLPFEGPVSISTVFDALVRRFGWTAKEEEGRRLELARGESRITLEPGVQMELSGRVHRKLSGVAEELRAYLAEVKAVSDPLGIRWAACGTHPTARVDRIPWIPKRRYAIMRSYLPKRGKLARNMMKGTCGTQVNLDFSDEADAVEKLRVAMTLTSTVTAMFANSPVTAGKRNGLLTQRAAIWLQTDPDRCGLLPFAFEPSATLDDYIRYALSVPMLFLVRRGQWIPLRGLTFGAFLKNGHDGERATAEDWQLHLTTLFPDVRLKSYLEVRGTDSTSPGLVLAHAALWKGILYGGKDIRRAAVAPLAGLGWNGHRRLRRDVSRLGLRAEAGGRPLLGIAREVLAVAGAGLAAVGSAGEDSYLDPLRELVIERGLTPAEDLLARLGPSTRRLGPTSPIDPHLLLDCVTCLDSF